MHATYTKWSGFGNRISLLSAGGPGPRLRLCPREVGLAASSYVFVVTYGRSGSTLVMGLLNSIPGYLIRGENRDAVHHLYDFHMTMVREKHRGTAEKLREPTHPFYGVGDFPRGRSRNIIRRLVTETVLRPEDDTRVTGFKEIRWYHDDLEDYVRWLTWVFPSARFLVNTRNLDDVARSKWWSKDPGVRTKLEEIEARIVALAASLGDAAYRVHYDEYVNDPTVLAGMYAWLGEEYDERRVKETLAVRHSIE